MTWSGKLVDNRSDPIYDRLTTITQQKSPGGTMQRITKLVSIPCLILAAVYLNPAIAAVSKVSSEAEFKTAVQEAMPGDTIQLANGTWEDFEILFVGNGKPGSPITLTAETKGKVIISGSSNLRIAGEHLVVSGLVFRDGFTPTSAVISFRRTNGEYANHSRVTEVVIDHFNNPERHEKDSWVMMYGKNNRFDHNHIVGKSNSGVTMAVRLDSAESQKNHHRIDHNYFGPRPVLGSNGGETLRIGTSTYSLTDSFTTVENNFFDRCDGEVEIISSKSGRNVFRGNVFFESRGTLTLRHGNDNLVEGNVFLGRGVDHTGGIRVINKRQTVRNNYLSGLTGHRFGGGLVVMNGVPNSVINRYHQVEDSIIENNTLINVEHIELAAGSDDERSAVPLTSAFRNNLIVNDQPIDSIAVHDDISGISFSGNIANNVLKLPAEDGFAADSVAMKQADNGLMMPASDTSIGADRDLAVLDREQTGVAWYEKPGYGGKFDGGTEISVSPGEDALFNAVASASPGDVLQLSDGEYLSAKIIVIEIPLTIRGSRRSAARLKFERSTLFEIVDGGSLKLERLHIDGSAAPDAYANSVIRTSRYSMLSNYDVELNEIDVVNLNTNHSFNLLEVWGHTFAQDISIRNSSVSEVSGHIVQLHRETDDLGIYNGEYITITDSKFENIGGSVATVYRGGTDESTFGPHFIFRNNRVDNAGHNKRNQSKASILLHGVQVASLRDNEFRNSLPIMVIETVGEPITRTSNNEFHKTDTPIIRSIFDADK